MKNTICFDCGSSQIKYIILSENSRNGIIRNNYENEINKLISSEKFNKIIFTGSQAKKYSAGYDSVILDELKSIGNLIKYLGYDNGLVINIGTGTSFVKYDNGIVTHLIGSGLGGGTYAGLSQRLLHTSDLSKVEDIAYNGDLSHINTQIRDIEYEEKSWFQGDLTVANFSKQGMEKSDIAIGIHSIIAEPIMSILKSLTIANHFELIIFSGGMINNALFRSFLTKYSDIFSINSAFLENPDFGTCYGAIVLAESMEK